MQIHPDAEQQQPHPDEIRGRRTASTALATESRLFARRATTERRNVPTITPRPALTSRT